MDTLSTSESAVKAAGNPSYAKPWQLHLSLFIERFSYYGLRAFMVLFLVATYAEGGAEMEQVEALTLYATFTTIYYVTPIFAGLFADFVLPRHKVAAIGAGLLAIGAISTAYLPTEYVALGFFIAALGVGAFKPCIYAMFAEHYRQTPGKMDGAFTLMMLTINIGAALAPLLIGMTFEDYGYGVAFHVVAVTAALAALSVGLSVNKENIIEATELVSGELQKWIKLFLGIAAIYCFYWVIYDLAQPVFNEFKQQAFTVDILPQFIRSFFGLDESANDGYTPGILNVYLQLAPMLFLLIGYIVFSIAWFRTSIHSGVKLAVGLFAYALAWILVGHIVTAEQTPTLFTFILLIELMLVVSELLVDPIILSMIGQYSPRKLMATSFGILSLMNLAINSLGPLQLVLPENGLVYMAIVSGLLGAVVLVLVRKKAVG